MTDFGVTGKLGGYYLAEQYRKNAAGKSEGVSFAELAATKAAGKTENVSFKEMRSEERRVGKECT